MEILANLFLILILVCIVCRRLDWFEDIFSDILFWLFETVYNLVEKIRRK